MEERNLKDCKLALVIDTGIKIDGYDDLAVFDITSMDLVAPHTYVIQVKNLSDSIFEDGGGAGEELTPEQIKKIIESLHKLTEQ